MAIITEILFLPLYKGQKLFGDIFSLLRDKGFHFVKFLKITEYSPYRAAIGLRGEGFQSWGDALFFRKIEDIKNIKDLSIQQEMLDKLAFISIVFHQFEYALECIKQSKECRKLIGLDKDDKKKYSYIKMLREIEIEVENLKKRFPPTFADKYSFEESKARFEIYSAYGENEQQSVGPKSKDIKEYDDSNIEKILRNYSLEQQVDIIKKLRIQQDTGLDLPDKGEMRAKQ